MSIRIFVEGNDDKNFIIALLNDFISLTNVLYCTKLNRNYIEVMGSKSKLLDKNYTKYKRVSDKIGFEIKKALFIFDDFEKDDKNSNGIRKSLNWNIPIDVYIFDKNLDYFLVETINKKECYRYFDELVECFDIEKLKWMNSQYINKLSPEDLLKFSEEFIVERYPEFKTLGNDKKILIMKAIAPRIDLLTQAPDWVDYFYKKFELDEAAKEIESTEDYRIVKEELIKAVKEENDFSVENHKPLIKKIQKNSKRKGKALFMSIRVAVTGRTHGPDLNYIFAVIGKEEILKRLGE